MTDVIVVTGAAQGMGRACVDRLVGGNDTVLAVDLEAPAIDGTTGVACDVSDTDAVAALAEQVRATGTFRGLIHAAGISPTMGEPERIFAVDLVGTRLLLDAFEPLVTTNSAAVCFASSAAHQVALMGANPDMDAFVADPLAPDFASTAAGHFPDSGLAYAWAKRGVITAVNRAAIRWGRAGGRVVSISPGMIDTGMGQQEFEAQPMMPVMLDATPLARMGRPDEIADLALFLLSERASFITGTDVLADGGCLQGLRSLAGQL